MTTKTLLKRKPTGKFKMHQFQVEDLSFLIELDNSANWSEMGAMKTSTVEWLIEAKLSHIANPRILIVTTRSGKGTYFESLWEVLPEFEVFSINTTKRNLVIGGRKSPFNVKLPSPLFHRPIICVANYHCFTDRACQPKIIEENGLPVFDPNTGLFAMTNPPCGDLLRMHWDMVILDEAHRIKNPTSQWTHNINKIKAQYKHAMTGTGFINNPLEVWAILNWMYPKIYTSRNKFRNHYCETDDYDGYKKIVGIKPDKEDEFRELVRRVGVRRTMLECFPGIQEPILTTVPVELNPRQKKMYDEIKTHLHTLDSMGVPLHTPNVLSMLNRLRQICVATPEVTEDYFDMNNERRIIKVKLTEPSSKLDAVMDVLDGLESHDQVVVFSSFKDPLELLKIRLTKAKIPYLHMSADMNDDDRYIMWHDTWPKKEHRVFLCTLAVGSESINLTSAHRAIFLDQSWSPKDNNQAIGRIYRPGQTEAAQLIYIRAEGTVDDRILQANEQKNGWFKQIFGVIDVGDEDDEEEE